MPGIQPRSFTNSCSGIRLSRSQSIGAGPTAASAVTVTSNGTGPVTLTGAPGIGGPDASQFQVAQQPGDCPSGDVLPPSGSCNLHVAFDPSSAGDKSAQLTVSSNAPPVQVDLTGTGILAQLSRSPAHSTELLRRIGRSPHDSVGRMRFLLGPGPLPGLGPSCRQTDLNASGG